MAKNKFGGFPMGGNRGGFGGGNMNQLMQQLQKVQSEMMQSQEEIKKMEISASSGGGMVKATLNGEKKIVALEIKPDVVDPDDIETLSDLIISAINEAHRLIDEESSKKMPALPNIPGMGGLF